MEIDGNVDQALLGGKDTSGLMNYNYDGFIIDGSTNIAIENVNAHHFGRDGLQLTDDWPKYTEDVLVVDSRFELNLRQAFSWTGGDLFRSVNSSFSFTGQVQVSVGGTYTNYYNGHGAGIDIERTTSDILTNGYFKDCRIFNNAKSGFVIGVGGQDYWVIGDLEFDNCTFWSDSYYNLEVRRARNTVFENCNFYGIINDISGSGVDDQVVFDGCYFTDIGLNGKDPYLAGKKLLNLKDGTVSIHPIDASQMFYRFTDCTFETHKVALFYGSEITNSGMYEIYNDWECNTFIAYTEELMNAGLACGGGGKIWINELANARFYSNVFLDKNPVSTAPAHSCNTTVFFELYNAANLRDGQNIIIPHRPETNYDTRLIRQKGPSSSAESMSREPF